MFVNFRIKCNITPPTKENPLCYNKTHKNNNQKPPAITPLKVAYIITAPQQAATCFYSVHSVILF